MKKGLKLDLNTGVILTLANMIHICRLLRKNFIKLFRNGPNGGAYCPNTLLHLHPLFSMKEDQLYTKGREKMTEGINFIHLIEVRIPL